MCFPFLKCYVPRTWQWLKMIGPKKITFGMLHMINRVVVLRYPHSEPLALYSVEYFLSLNACIYMILFGGVVDIFIFYSIESNFHEMISSFSISRCRAFTVDYGQGNSEENKQGGR